METQCSYWIEMERQLGPSLDRVLRGERERVLRVTENKQGATKTMSTISVKDLLLAVQTISIYIFRFLLFGVVFDTGMIIFYS